jgi:hypothetical protein
MADANQKKDVALHSNDLAETKAKELFFEYRSYREIGNAVGVNASTIFRWAEAGLWRDERARQHKELTVESFERNQSQLRDFWKMGIPFMYNSLVIRIQNKQYLSITEIKQLLDAFVNLEKLWRLAQGEATEIFGAAKNERALTYQELKKIIESDSFSDIKIKDVTNEPAIQPEGGSAPPESSSDQPNAPGTTEPGLPVPSNSENTGGSGSGGTDNTSPGNDVGSIRYPFSEG